MAGQHQTKNAALANAITQQQPPVMPYVPPGQFIDIDERFYRGRTTARRSTILNRLFRVAEPTYTASGTTSRNHIKIRSLSNCIL